MSELKRKIDDLGRIKIPQEIINKLNILPKSCLTLSCTQDMIIIMPRVNYCSMCGSIIVNDNSFHLCKQCIAKIKEDQKIEKRFTPYTVRRRIDELGRIVIPMEYRTTLNICEKGVVELKLEHDMIVLRPHNYVCKYCGHPIKASVKYRICSNCIKEITCL